MRNILQLINLRNYHLLVLVMMVLLLLKPNKGISQIISFSDQYVLYPLLINPAFSGDRNALNIASYYRQQWLGMKGAPDNLNLTADFSTLKGKLGLGVQYQNESYGVNTMNKFMSFYAYRIKFQQSELGFGLGAGFFTSRSAWSKLKADEPGDEEFLVDSKNYYLPEFSFGIKYRYKTFFTGFSVPDLLSYSFKYEESKYKFRADPKLFTYQLFGGNIFKISPQTNLLPSALLSYSAANQLEFDLNIVASFNEKIWIGGMYHNTKSVTGLVQFALSDQLLLAYSYEMNFGKISNASKGSHEFMIRYEFRYKANVSSPLKF